MWLPKIGTHFFFQVVYRPIVLISILPLNSSFALILLTSYQRSNDQGQDHQLEQSHEEFTGIGNVRNGEITEIQRFQKNPNEYTEEDSGKSDDQKQILL